MRAISTNGRGVGRMRAISSGAVAPSLGQALVTLSATNAAGTGTQTLTLTIVRPTIAAATISATNAAGTGSTTLNITITR